MSETTFDGQIPIIKFEYNFKHPYSNWFVLGHKLAVLNFLACEFFSQILLGLQHFKHTRCHLTVYQTLLTLKKKRFAAQIRLPPLPNGRLKSEPCCHCHVCGGKMLFHK
uniref:Uncharacterized protein n=1 Tax=Fundulus heteroclitus TaxID=8078 RepID=A0A3Q2QXF1_FUNHE